MTTTASTITTAAPAQEDAAVASGAAVDLTAAGEDAHGRPAAGRWARRAVLGLNLLLGADALVMGTGHIVGVAAKYAQAPGPFVYDFRAYSLMLLGAVIAVPGAALAFATRGLARGERGPFRLAVALTLWLLAVTAPALPLVPGTMPFIAALNLGALWLGRARLLAGTA
ncbi:MAG TPA: hypothetical protein VG389_14615 [Myxococcota bacterium]|jgi:hypothetical protein|nr:hypothetical protein [Myxococcota bacterium]